MDGLKVQILGKDAFKKSLLTKAAAILKNEGEATARATRLVEGSAKRKVRKKGSGIVYGKHQASSPGEPPASDTGNLINLISTEVTFLGKRKGFEGVVRSGADYSMALEFGTRKMSARPFLKPSLLENLPKIKSLYEKALNKGLNAE